MREGVVGLCVLVRVPRSQSGQSVVSRERTRERSLVARQVVVGSGRISVASPVPQSDAVTHFASGYNLPTVFVYLSARELLLLSAPSSAVQLVQSWSRWRALSLCSPLWVGLTSRDLGTAGKSLFLRPDALRPEAGTGLGARLLVGPLASPPSLSLPFFAPSAPLCRPSLRRRCREWTAAHQASA
jgi:hypothetical protein